MYMSEVLQDPGHRSGGEVFDDLTFPGAMFAVAIIGDKRPDGSSPTVQWITTRQVTTESTTLSRVVQSSSRLPVQAQASLEAGSFQPVSGPSSSQFSPISNPLSDALFADMRLLHRSDPGKQGDDLSDRSQLVSTYRLASRRTCNT